MKRVMPCAFNSSMHSGAPATTRMALSPRRACASGASVAYSSSLEQSTTDVGFCCRGGVDTGLYRIETEVVDDFVSGTAEEVARELRPGQSHGQVADGQHEYLGPFARFLGSQTQGFEVGSSTHGLQCRHFGFALFVVVATAGV